VFSTVGIRVVAHYCGGSLEDVALFSKPSSCCGGEEDEADDCCKNDSKHIVFQKDFTFYKIVADAKTPVQKLFLIDRHLLSVFSYRSVASIDSGLRKKIHPPNLVQEDIISVSVLRI